MKNTLKEQKELINLQYVLESLIEYYEVAQNESDRYYIKGQLLEFISDFNVSLDFIKAYLQLQPKKFQPFIKTLSNIKDSPLDKRQCCSIKSCATRHFCKDCM